MNGEDDDHEQDFGIESKRKSIRHFFVDCMIERYGTLLLVHIVGIVEALQHQHLRRR